MHPLRSTAVVTIVIVAIAACGGGGSSAGITGTPTVDHVVMSQASATISVGQTVALGATGIAADGTPVAAGAQWSTAAASIATVSQFGNVTGVAPGLVDITATVGGKTGRTAITVLAQGTGSTGDYTDIAIAPTLWTTCARRSVGQVRCWGMNPDGQLGDGTTTDRALPAAVSTTLSFAQADVGNAQSCGRTAAGDVYCWGNLHFGTGTTDRSLAPRAVGTGINFADISIGQEDACGRTSAGVAYCWGNNQYGAVGDGTNSARAAPVAVSGGLTFSQVTVGGQFACGRTSAGAVYCWGRNANNQLGDGTNTDRLVPTRVSGTVVFSAVSAGLTDVCGLSTAGAIYCWGTAFTVVPGTGGVSSVPTLVTSSQAFTQIATGVFHACALTATGAAWCWGENDHREIGDGSTVTTRNSPVAVAGGLAFAKITAGHWYTCGVTLAGTAYCWGYNGYGNIGDGTMTTRAEPALVK